jgi:hypothetical protein
MNTEDSEHIPMWWTRDPEKGVIAEVDIAAAAADGVAIFRVTYEKDINNIACEALREDGSR